jgi:TRAP-type C4-dicarboxylate transport system permease small subunit
MGAVMTRAENVVLAVLMSVLLADVTLQVAVRYTAMTFTWTEELARYTFIYATFIGSVAAIRDRSHVSIDICVKALPRPLRLAVSLAVDAVTIVGFGYLLYWGVLTTLKVRVLRSVALEISFSAIYAIVPISLALMILRLALRMAEDVRRYRRGQGGVEDMAKSIV